LLQSNWWGAGLYYDKALSLFLQEPTNNESNIAVCHYKLAQVYYNMEHTAKAEVHYLKALPTFVRKRWEITEEEREKEMESSDSVTSLIHFLFLFFLP
jgi:hypothetical protein